jgi:hypothetical protein
MLQEHDLGTPMIDEKGSTTANRCIRHPHVKKLHIPNVKIKNPVSHITYHRIESASGQLY